MAPELPPESPAQSTSSSPPNSPHPFPSLPTGLNGRAVAHTPTDASTAESSSNDYFSRAQRTARERQPSGVSSSTSRRLSFATANSSLGSRPRLDPAEQASTSDDEDSSEGDSEGLDDNALSSQGLGLALASSPSKRSKGRKNTIVTPFSRPPSAVTSYGGPSRPGSAAVDSVKSRDRLTPAGSTSRRALAGSSKLSAMPPSPPSWGEQMSQASGPRRGSREEDVLASRELKGKSREVDTAPPSLPRTYEMPLTDDPLDPLSSMYHGPGSASATEHESPRSQGQNERNGGTRASHRQSLQRPPRLGLPHEPPPAPAATTAGPLSATSYSSTDSVASTSHVTISSTSRSGPSSSTGASTSAQAPPQPSLQQLLQTVDLSAALRLVQTLQAQQNQQQQPAPAPPPTSAPHVPSSVPSQAPSHPSFPPNSPPASALPPRHAPSLHPYDTAPPLTSHPSSSHLLSPPAASPAPSSPHEGPSGSAVEEKKDRRRSLSIGFGVAAVGKRLRTSSTVSASPSTSGLARVSERVPDERAAMSEAGRWFEEQISRVHLSLSPATLRRAQNCAKYLSLRYTPVYTAISNNTPIPNPVNVARWRQEKEELDRRQRRVKIGGSTTAVGRLGKINGVGTGAGSSRDDLGLSTDGEVKGRPSDASSASSPVTTGGHVSVYGPRRNKYPKAWEIYPDDVSDYVASGGQVQEPAEMGGAPLRAGISSLTRVSSLGSEGGGKSTAASASGAPSSTWNGFPILPTSPLSSSKQHLFGSSNGSSNRPGSSRENSFEGSPLARSGTSRTSTSAELAGSTSLKRASSLTAAAGAISNPTAGNGLGPAFAKSTEANALGNAYGSPRSRVASARASRDFLPSPTTKTEPSSPRIHVNGHSPLLNGHQLSPPSAKPQQAPPATGSMGVRSNISRRLDRIRGKAGNGGAGTEGETSDGRGGAPMARRESDAGAGWASPDPSDNEPGHLAHTHPHGRSPQRSSLAQLSDQGPFGRRPKLRKNATSFDFGRGFDTDGYKSSGGEEGGGRRRASRGIFAAAWQGFKGSLDAYPGGDDPLGFGQGGPAAMAAARRTASGEMSRSSARRRIIVDESDDEEVKAPREVLDLGDDEYTQLNAALRQLRGELANVDAVLPRIPFLLNDYLDEITAHEAFTRNTLGIPVHYAFPRLPASVVAQLATTRAKQHSPPFHTDSPMDITPETSSSESSESDSTSSSEDSDDESDDVQPSSRRRRPPRQSSLKVHSRRVTDPISRKPMGRPRSHTTGFPLGSIQSPSRAGTPLRSSTLAVQHRVDPLVVLERAIEELEKATKAIDEEASRVQAMQEKVDAGIAEVVAAVDEAQKAIDDTGFQQLRMLEDHYFRLRTSLTRPSSSIDALWALLAGALTVVFWLSWLFVTFFRIIRSIVTLPLTVVRWLFFLR